MLLFWLFIILMSLIAFSILFIPLLWRSRGQNLDARQLSILLYQQKLENLADEKAQGEITADDYAQTRIRLEKSLLEETAVLTPVKNTPKQGRVVWIVGLALFFFCMAGVLYWQFGGSTPLRDYLLAQKGAAQIESEIKQLGSVENIITRLQQQVEKKPDSRGWYLLGRLYMKNQQWHNAIHAFWQADQLQPAQVEVLVSYAEALYLAQHNSLDLQAKKLLQQVLQLQPNQPDAINLLAVDAYQNADYKQAVHYWQQLLAQLNPQTEVAQNISQMLALAQQKAGAIKAQIKLHIEVTLPEHYKAQISGDEALFVYAQAINGPAMPLAVVRRSAKDLPLTVTLDETMAMLPGTSLASVDQVRIVARLSKSGQPLPAPGDLEGHSPTINPHQPPELIRIVMDHENQ